MLPKGEQEADICRVSERKVSLQGEAGTARAPGLPVSERTSSGPKSENKTQRAEGSAQKAGGKAR